jgi:plastocyanin
MASTLTHVTATDDITTESAILKSLAVTGSGAAGVAVVRRGGSGGTIVATLRAPTGDTVTWTAADPDGALCADGIHVTVTTAEVTVEHE